MEEESRAGANSISGSLSLLCFICLSLDTAHRILTELLRNIDLKRAILVMG